MSGTRNIIQRKHSVHKIMTAAFCTRNSEKFCVDLKL